MFWISTNPRKGEVVMKGLALTYQTNFLITKKLLPILALTVLATGCTSPYDTTYHLSPSIVVLYEPTAPVPEPTESDLQAQNEAAIQETSLIVGKQNIKKNNTSKRKSSSGHKIQKKAVPSTMPMTTTTVPETKSAPKATVESPSAPQATSAPPPPK
ncbi:MAG: hypothetical protein H7832_15265 [Magnetococcus sp. DMHC-6]